MNEVKLANRLTDAERASLAEHEQIIAQGMQTFVEVGNALAAINADKLLLREAYTTFEDYCKSKWGFGRSRASRLMDAADVYANLLDLLPVGNILPANERQARPLADLEPAKQGEAWQAVLKECQRQDHQSQLSRRRSKQDYG